jgi:hypothetical protein
MSKLRIGDRERGECCVHTAFVCRVGMVCGPVQEEKGRPGGPVQNISDVGGGASLPAQELTHCSLYNIITHKRLSHRQQFSASQDADSISVALNNSCPRSHFHTGNNATIIPLSGFTVYV